MPRLLPPVPPWLRHTRAKRSTRMCFSILDGRLLFFFPCFAEHGCLGGSWPRWESRSVKAVHTHTDTHTHIYIHTCVYFVSLCRHWPGPFCQPCVKVTIPVSWLLVGYSPMLSSTLHPPGQPTKNEEVRKRLCRLMKQEISVRGFWSSAHRGKLRKPNFLERGWHVQGMRN